MWLCARAPTRGALGAASPVQQLPIEPVSASSLRKNGNFLSTRRDIPQKSFFAAVSGDQRLVDAQKSALRAFSPFCQAKTERADLVAGAPGFEPGNGGIKIRLFPF
jgi:hypothetical protein